MIRALLLLITVVLVVACDDSSSPSGDSPRCDPDASPTVLASKYDDDDGDGNPLDEDFPDIDDEDDDIADHAWIRDRFGVYHLFFHSESLYHPNQIEHYTTRDFRSLDYVGVALTVAPGGWDGDALWAPHVVEHDRIYYMFYTGVAGSNGPDAVQRIGLATSTNLITWTRAPINRCPGTSGDGCVYECDEAWTTWGDGGAFDDQCRDPFVMWDDASERWLMFVTAKSTNGFGVVTVASADEFSTWSGGGFIDATRRLATGTGGQTTGGQAENPFVVETDDTYYLLFSDWQDIEDSVTVAPHRTVVQYATSPSLAVDDVGSADWIYRGYTPDPGVNAIEVIEFRRGSGRRWLMSQSISSPRSGFPKPQRRQLLVRCANFENDLIETSNWGVVPDGTGVTAVDLTTSD
ncbi:MAG: family 43 glycosylhydrolase [Candidatus Latescibacteria bacterium]|nr:family 43 glycosylhydrolase [Candidatus Latescibacterota bacterium]